MEVCNSGARCPFLAGVVSVTSRLFGVENGRVYWGIRFEQSPEQVVRDLVILEKRRKTGRGRNVGSTHVLHQQVEVLELHVMVAIAFKFCSMGFQFRDVVIQQVSLKLFRY